MDYNDLNIGDVIIFVNVKDLLKNVDIFDKYKITNKTTSLVEIENMNGKNFGFFRKDRFKTIEQIRLEKLNEIYSKK